MILVKITVDSSYFRKKMLYLQIKELFDSIATQNAEIRTVAKSYIQNANFYRFA